LVNGSDFGQPVALNGGNATLLTTGLPAGADTITAMCQGSGETVTFGPVAATVTTAPLTVTVNNASKSYGSADPAFTVSYCGLVNGDSPASLAGALVFTTNEPAGIAPVGSYSIMASGLTSMNYVITFATGTLTVSRATPTITWANPASITYGTALSAAQLDATASVSGTFLYTPAAGAVLAAGTETLSVTFTPANTTDYSSV